MFERAVVCERLSVLRESVLREEECFSMVGTSGEWRGETRRRKRRERLHDTTSAATVLAHNPTSIQGIVHHSPPQPEGIPTSPFHLSSNNQLPCGGMDSAWTHPTTFIPSFGGQQKNTNGSIHHYHTQLEGNPTPSTSHLPTNFCVAAWTRHWAHPTFLTPSFSGQ